MKTQILIVILLLISTLTFSQEEQKASDLRRVPMQFTLFTPPIGTNGIYFYKTINDVSLNTFIGVGAASEYLELSGFINANRFYSNGVQASGFINLSGFDRGASEYSSQGAQLSGFANINGNDYKGFQWAGFSNINRNFNGFQVSGFLNFNRSANNSFLIAGFANVNDSTDNSYQGAGFANFSSKGVSRLQLASFGNFASDVTGVQGAGFGNWAKDVKGIQGAGFANWSRDISGIQGAGFANFARDVKGIQGSGFMNIARNVKGVQLAGFINICDSIEGIPVSFISIVKKNGYRNFEISTTDWAPVQLTYRMGVEKFYSIYTISKLTGGLGRYALGFGFGHNSRLFDKTQLNIELTSHQEYVWGPGRWFLFYAEKFNNISQFKIGLRRNLFKNIWINAGPTLNLASSYYLPNTEGFKGSDIKPYWNVKQNTFDRFPNWRNSFWVGFHVGLNLF